MARRGDINDPNATAYPETTTRRHSNWGWAVAALVIILGVIAVVAWTWDYNEPVTTGTVATPPAGAPVTPTTPAVPPAGTPASPPAPAAPPASVPQ